MGNFIDKTFTVIADILLKILPASKKEKEAFHKKSLGFKLTKERINAINKLHNCNIKIEIEDLKTDESIPKGTKVMVYIIGLKKNN